MKIKLPYGIAFNSESFLVISGPCSVENEETLLEIALKLKEYGAHVLRGGTYKLRTSKNDFQGLKEEGLKILNRVGHQLEMPTVSEITAISQLDSFVKYVDIIQVGARNMYNYPLLEELGKIDKPVILKRAFSATIKEWLMAAEYITSGGNNKVILCERGIRTFETYTRNTLDLSAVLAVKSLSDYLVIVDPSHATGRKEMVTKMALAAYIVGANGVMIESHVRPNESKSDANQAISLDEFLIFKKALNGLKR